MRLTFAPAPRRLAVPIWAMVLAGLWLAGVAAIVIVRGVEGAPDLCVFRRVTHVPCPTCGTTRAILALGRGDPLAAVALNPFVVIALAVLALVVAARIILGRRVVVHWSRRQRAAALIALAALFLANWAYVIWSQAP